MYVWISPDGQPAVKAVRLSESAAPAAALALAGLGVAAARGRTARGGTDRDYFTPQKINGWNLEMMVKPMPESPRFQGAPIFR